MKRKILVAIAAVAITGMLFTIGSSKQANAGGYSTKFCADSGMCILDWGIYNYKGHRVPVGPR